MLCQHNESFYDLGDYHAYLINQMTQDQKDKVIDQAQRTFSNLSFNDTTDFQEMDMYAEEQEETEMRAE